MFFVSDIHGNLSPLARAASQTKQIKKDIERVVPVESAHIYSPEPDFEAQKVTPTRSAVTGSYQAQVPVPERKPALLAKDIMTAPVHTLYQDDTLEMASRLFKERTFRHVPILSRAGKLVGILSDRDFLHGPSDPGAVTASIMSSNILTARPEALIRDVAQIMYEHKVGSMPIVNDAGVLVGILTRSDILRAIVHHAPIELWI